MALSQLLEGFPVSGTANAGWIKDAGNEQEHTKEAWRVSQIEYL